MSSCLGLFTVPPTPPSTPQTTPAPLPATAKVDLDTLDALFALPPGNALGLYLEDPAWPNDVGPSLTIADPRPEDRKVEPLRAWGVVDLPPPPLVVQAQPAAHTPPAAAALAVAPGSNGHNAPLSNNIMPHPVAGATTGGAGSSYSSPGC